MRRLNLYTSETGDREGRPPGYRSSASNVGEAIGGDRLAGKLYELPPGESVCPYHYELGDEEWLIVLDGRATVRHPGGEDELEPGDVACFPPGPAGAHKVMNRSEAIVRVLIVSTHRLPSVAIYPDSDKVGVFTDDEREDLLVRRTSAVDYWDGEA